MEDMNAHDQTVLVMLPRVLIDQIKDEMFDRDKSKSDAIRWLLLQAWERRHDIVLDNRVGPFDARLICYQPSELIERIKSYAAEHGIGVSVALQKFIEAGLSQAQKERDHTQ